MLAGARVRVRVRACVCGCCVCGERVDSMFGQGLLLFASLVEGIPNGVFCLVVDTYVDEMDPDQVLYRTTISDSFTKCRICSRFAVEAMGGWDTFRPGKYKFGSCMHRASVV